MRIYLWGTAAALMLSACGGGGTGLNTLNGVGLGGGTVGAGTGGSGGGGTGGPGTISGSTGVAPNLLNQTAARTYSTYSASQRLILNSVGPDVDNAVVASTVYDANQPAGLTTDVKITYDPRDATFSLEVPSASIGFNNRYQDPLHRTVQPQPGTPVLGNLSTCGGGVSCTVQYYESGAADADGNYDISTFFFETPGVRTRYVTYAGFFRRIYDVSQTQSASGASQVQVSDTLGRSTFVYGFPTARPEVPTAGTARYDGGFFAFTVGEPNNPGSTRALSHVTGTSTFNVDFATGRLNASFLNDQYSPEPFSATGSASINRLAGGFAGTISAASIANQPVNIAASSLEGNFFGPAADEIGGALRIVGGTPDERVDILGSFTGVHTGN